MSSRQLGDAPFVEECLAPGADVEGNEGVHLHLVEVEHVADRDALARLRLNPWMKWPDSASG